MSKITVSIQVGRFPDERRDRIFCMELDPLQHEALEPLDFPSSSSGMFCTPDAVVRRVEIRRAITAQEMARAIAAAMRSADTYDGDIPVDPLTGLGRAAIAKAGGAA